MTKIVQKASIALTTGVLAFAAHAECGKFDCVNVKVVAHYVRDNGDALIQLSGKPWNLGCKPTRYVYVTVPASSPDFTNLYAHLAAYKLMDKDITVHIDPRAKECTIESFEAAAQ